MGLYFCPRSFPFLPTSQPTSFNLNTPSGFIKSEELIPHAVIWCQCVRNLNLSCHPGYLRPSLSRKSTDDMSCSSRLERYSGISINDSYLLINTTDSATKRNSSATPALNSTASSCKPTPFDSPVVDFPRYISGSCTPGQAFVDRLAWAEAGLLAHAISKSFSDLVRYKLTGSRSMEAT
jgi:hypothetical protein